MTRRILLAEVLGLLLLGLVIYPLPAFAQSNQPSEVITDTTEEFLLTDLGMALNEVLLGPNSQVEIQFWLPLHWELQTGATLELEISSYFSSLIPNENATLPEDVVIGELSVWLNGKKSGSIQLEESDIASYTITLNAGDFINRQGNGLNSLVVRWDALGSCQQGIGSSITLLAGSRLRLPHAVTSTIADLTIYPAPFYAENNLFLPNVRLVVPDQVEEEELQAALAIAAGLGNLSRGSLQVTLNRWGDVTEQMKNEDHLFFIGRIDQLALIKDGRFDNLVMREVNAVEIQPQEGLLMEFISPWQPARMLVVVSGQNGSAVLQAGQALGSGKFITSGMDSLAKISSLSIPGDEREFAIDTTFADLGQETIKFTHPGVHKLTIPFRVDANKILSPEAYLDLVANHSTTVDTLQSGIWVKLNDIPIGSVRFSDQSTGTNLSRFIIPPSAISPLNNELEIEVNLVSSSACPLPGVDDDWITLFSDSTLHLPGVDAAQQLVAPLGIGDFPLPFIRAEGMQDVVFIVQKERVESWAAAANLAFEMGWHSGNDYFLGEVLFSNPLNSVPQDEKQWIVIGDSASMPFANGLNELLPAPFNADGTLQEAIATSINYSNIQGKSTGFLEVVNFSTVPMQEALLVLGNDGEGITLAADALLEDEVREEIYSDNFAVIQSGRVVSDSIRVPGAGATPTATVQSVLQGSTSLRLWLMFGLGLTLLAMAGLFISWLAAVQHNKKAALQASEYSRRMKEKKK